MGQGLVDAKVQPTLLRLADEAGLPLGQLLLEGSADQLRKTEVAQPALFYCGVALAEILLQGGLEPVAAAGHSLGEYGAVVAAGALEAEEGMRLVLERGRLMAQARQGTMAAVLGLELAQVEELCRVAALPGEVCVVANDNAPGQVVISGTSPALAELSARAREAGARRVVELKVSGAFHSPLMAAAQADFRPRLARACWTEPRFPVAAGLTGSLSLSADQVRLGLEGQLVGRVRWAEAVRALAEAGAECFLECGPGSTLTSLSRRIVPQLAAEAVGSPADARAWLERHPGGGAGGP